MNACGDSRLRGLRSRKPIGFRQWVVHTKMECFFKDGIKKENVIVCNGNIRHWDVHFSGGI